MTDRPTAAEVRERVTLRWCPKCWTHFSGDYQAFFHECEPRMRNSAPFAALMPQEPTDD